jgi:hypothetical protein
LGRAAEASGQVLQVASVVFGFCSLIVCVAIQALMFVSQMMWMLFCHRKAEPTCIQGITFTIIISQAVQTEKAKKSASTQQGPAGPSPPYLGWRLHGVNHTHAHIYLSATTSATSTPTHELNDKGGTDPPQVTAAPAVLAALGRCHEPPTHIPSGQAFQVQANQPACPSAWLTSKAK